MTLRSGSPTVLNASWQPEPTQEPAEVVRQGKQLKACDAFDLTETGREWQALLPMLELIEQAEMAVDELIDVAGRATIEAVLTLSAQEVAGPKHPGKRVGAIGWHGRQNGLVCLAERTVRISKPRLRQKGKARARAVRWRFQRMRPCGLNRVLAGACWMS
jgi:hypothetical protein